VAPRISAVIRADVSPPPGEASQLEKVRRRFEEISLALFRIASLDFSAPLVVELDGDVTDAVAGGINMLAEEVQAQLAARDAAEKELEGKVRDRTAELQTSLDQLAEYRVLFEMSRTLALVMAPDGTIRHASPGWGHVMGQFEGALVDQKVWDFFHPEDARSDAQASEGGVVAWLTGLDREEKRWRASDGSYRQLVWHTTWDAEHRIACAVAHDVTELRQAQHRAEEEQAHAIAASQVKSRFLANMSHEIRTPMSNVLGMTALALEEGLEGLQREYVEAAQSSANSLLAIVNDILDISKIEAGKLSIDAVPFSPRREVETALGPLFLRAREKRLETRLEIAGDVPEMVLGDAVRFRQVLVNLVFNALKFTDKGSISVGVAPGDDGESIHVIIADTGIGVAPEHVGTIFDAFRQGDESTCRTFGGTGLGLSICRELTRLMGGSIWLESEVGKGSSFHFTVRMPRATNAAANPGRGAPDVPAHARHSLRGPAVTWRARAAHQSQPRRLNHTSGKSPVTSIDRRARAYP